MTSKQRFKPTMVINQLFDRRRHILMGDQLGSLPAGGWLTISLPWRPSQGTSKCTWMSSSLFHGDLLPGTIASKCNSRKSSSSAKRRSNNQNVVVMQNVVVVLDNTRYPGRNW